MERKNAWKTFTKKQLKVFDQVTTENDVFIARKIVGLSNEMLDVNNDQNEEDISDKDDLE